MDKENAVIINSRGSGGSWKFAVNLSHSLGGIEVLTFKTLLMKVGVNTSFRSLKNLIKLIGLRIVGKDLSNRVVSMHDSLINKEKLCETLSQYDTIFICRWVNLISLESIIELSKESHVILIGVDDSQYTPYCSYVGDCKEYISGCSTCPKCAKSMLNRVRSDYSYAKDLLRKKGENITIQRANNDILEVIDRSFWSDSFVKQELKTFPYVPLHTEKEIINIQKSIELKAVPVILIGALRYTTRKGGPLIRPLLRALDSKLKIKNTLVEVRIFMSEFPDVEKYTDYENIHVNYSKPIPVKEFEKELISSNIFVSLSTMDSGPFTINMAHRFNINCIAFDVGVAPILAKESSNIFIVSNEDVKGMAEKIISNI